MNESISGRLRKVMGGQRRPWGVIGSMGDHRSHGKPWGGGIGSHWEPWKAIGGCGKPLGAMGSHERLWEATGGYGNPLGQGRPWELWEAMGGHGEAMGGRGEAMGGHACSLFAFCPVSFSQSLISFPLPNPAIFVRENEGSPSHCPIPKSTLPGT